MPFRDYFSKQAAQYAKHRPTYPEALFVYLASLAPSNELAWDCGTGNGQVAVALAGHFQRVIATDGSAEQIQNAFPHERVEYRVERAEQTTILPGSVDLITVGTAVHWFDFDGFYAEVRRVSKPGGVLAVWTYGLPQITPEVDAWLLEFNSDILKGYWPERIHYLEEHYHTLPFPFAEIQPPDFTITADWDLDCLVGFLASWSGVRRLIEAEGPEKVEAKFAELAELWGEATQKREVEWRLYFRIGSVGSI